MANGAGGSRFHRLISLALVAFLGGIDALYGRMNYSGDFLCYLNVSQAVSAHRWKAAFDPMWSAGYPILIALFRTFFPTTAEGEWYAICLLNFLIFLACYGAWRLLLRAIVGMAAPDLAAPELAAPEMAGAENRPAILLITTAIFLSYSLTFDSASRVAPDMLITTLFLMASALVLQLLSRPAMWHAVALGLVLGAGGWVKGVFVPFAGLFLLALALGTLFRKQPWLPVAAAALAFAVAFAPFVALTSWSYGHFTLGVTGALNYAFHVNNLPHWTNWQGGSGPFGTPLHPTRHLIADLPVFGFASPFQTTYPPYNNMTYWYEGYRHFSSLKSLFWAAIANLVLLRQLLRHPFFYALSIASLAVLLRKDWRNALRGLPPLCWIVFLAPVFGFAAYIAIHVEMRYLSPILMPLSLFPLFPLLDVRLPSRRTLVFLLAVLYPMAAVAELLVDARDVWRAALRGEDFHQAEQWRIAVALPAFGLRPGDPLATLDDNRPNFSWAYFDRMRLVAEFGGEPELDRTGEFFLHHPTAHESEDKDYNPIYSGLSAGRRAEVLQAMRNEGAVAVLSYRQPGEKPAPNWTPIPGTMAWIYLFPR